MTCPTHVFKCVLDEAKNDGHFLMRVMFSQTLSMRFGDNFVPSKPVTQGGVLEGVFC